MVENLRTFSSDNCIFLPEAEYFKRGVETLEGLPEP